MDLREVLPLAKDTALFVAALLVLSFSSCAPTEKMEDTQENIRYDLSGMIYLEDHLYFSVQEIDSSSNRYSSIVSSLKVLGTVAERFEQYEVPSTEFSSNCLSVGTEIHVSGSDMSTLYIMSDEKLYPYQRDDLYDENNPPNPTESLLSPQQG